jgi:peptide/nickel transport system substrate-binding protein/oligopeptide transport system substrate-binding protein
MDNPYHSSRLEPYRQAKWAGLTLLLSACGAPAPQLRDDQTLVRLADDDIKSIDPQAASDLATMRIASEQFEGATRLNAKGEPEPGLAMQWQASPDGLTWRFAIRPGLRFSDGQPIGAQDLVAAWRRLTDPRAASPLAELARPIANMNAADQHTLIVTLKHPIPHLPELMAHPALAALPLHRANWPVERPVTASGAYRLTEWALGDHVLLNRNPAWHDGHAPIAHIAWKPVSDSLTGMRSFLGKQADIASEFPASRLQDLKSRLGPIAAAIILPSTQDDHPSTMPASAARSIWLLTAHGSPNR